MIEADLAREGTGYSPLTITISEPVPNFGVPVAELPLEPSLADISRPGPITAALDPDRFLRYESETSTLAAEDPASLGDLATGSILRGAPDVVLGQPGAEAAALLSEDDFGPAFWAEMRASYEAQLTP